MKFVKRVVKWLGILIVVLLLAAGAFVGFQTMAYGRSMAKVYDIPMPAIARTSDPAVIARGKHLSESVAACATRDCHGNDFAGGKTIDIGPIGALSGPNLTTAGRGRDYTDGELARLMLHGVKRDGTSVRFMPVEEINWLPDDDMAAIISYLRSMPPVEKPDGETHIGVLGKVLDRLDKIPLDIARRVDHQTRKVAPTPAPTAAYGSFIAQTCQGCHGAHFSGGRIPGAPKTLPIPKNITPHETGIKLYTFDDFSKLLDTGIKRDGTRLDPFMPVEAIGKMSPLERQALWAYLQALPPAPFGGR